MKREPGGGWPEGAEGWTLDQIEQYVADQRAKPINRAYWKLYNFVNDCVGDQDFKRSPALLDLLIIMRDELADGASEDWSLDDYLEPVMSKWRSYQASRRNAGLKRECQLEWLEKKKADPKLRKANFALGFWDRHIGYDDKGNENSPKSKRIAEVWLSPEELQKVQ